MESKVDINIIYAFCNAGQKILEINGRYYAPELWDASTTTMLKHKLTGRDITEVVSTSTQFANMNVDPVTVNSAIMRFQDFKKRTIEFHGSIPYILYI